MSGELIAGAPAWLFTRSHPRNFTRVAHKQLCNYDGHVLAQKHKALIAGYFHISSPPFFTFDVVQCILVVFHGRDGRWRRRCECFKPFMRRCRKVSVFRTHVEQLVYFARKVIGIEPQPIFQVRVVGRHFTFALVLGSLNVFHFITATSNYWLGRPTELSADKGFQNETTISKSKLSEN